MEKVEQFTNREVRPMRVNACMTQAMFAKAAGVSRAYIIKLENSPVPVVIPDEIRAKFIELRKQLEA